MAKDSRSEANPYVPSGAVLRSDMPDGFVPPEDMGQEKRPTRRWSRFVLWTMRGAAGLYLILSAVTFYFAMTPVDRPQGAPDERGLFGPSTPDPSSKPDRMMQLIGIQVALQRATTALLLLGVAEAIALLLARPR